MLKYYKGTLWQYSKVNAFPGKSFADTWALFNDLRSTIAQMTALYIPVCDEESCLNKTPSMHEKSIMKIMNNDGQPLKPVVIMSQYWS